MKAGFVGNCDNLFAYGYNQRALSSIYTYSDHIKAATSKRFYGGVTGGRTIAIIKTTTYRRRRAMHAEKLTAST
ncbi:uncharacterized protein PHALS_01149 [Plasmopara halstedii]|uniref:Uncharacterized protein n=1 Tax=Plasmopara halstedii TaxID=4781 RepID=A0A0P1ATJ6_PLAHL|nr:uncharacterized protein PHALS_01149 [Plasmopara halstedii]CEG44814.1 hypothetical protein PHALS_01149 [Plasmopara halstedii]|eukprot:XP_024581183.1 hypothetical protein PHALS_01149 [Plasmopara halstedii]